MAQLIITVNDNIVVDVRDTLAQYWGMPNYGAATATQKINYVRGIIAAKLKDEYSTAKSIAAGEAAALSARTTAAAADIT